MWRRFDLFQNRFYFAFRLIRAAVILLLLVFFSELVQAGPLDGFKQVRGYGSDPGIVMDGAGNSDMNGFLDSETFGEQANRMVLQATLSVCGTDCDYASIQEAINAANAGDTIHIGAGTYLENLTIDKDLVLQGADQATTIIDGQGRATVVAIQADRTVSMSHVTITNGLASNGTDSDIGGGVFNQGILTIRHCMISDNHANGSGGGIYNYTGKSVVVSQCTIKNNTTNNAGGGILNQADGTMSVSLSTISDNSALFGGGILNNFAATLTLVNSTVSGNRADDQGGGIDNFGLLKLLESTVSSNSATGGGGGISNSFYGGTELNNSTVNDNNAGLVGGGISSYGALSVINSTISGNRAKYGGAIDSSEEATISHSTITDNHASVQGGGIYHTDERAVELSGTIVANNGNNADCVGPITSLGYNLSSDDSCNLTATGDKPNTNPLLAPLADNDGPTFTHALTEGSRAIDHIDRDVCTVNRDQRGAFRAQGAGCDIGAFEVGSLPFFIHLPIMMQNSSTTPPPPPSSCNGLEVEGEAGELFGDFVVEYDEGFPFHVQASEGKYVHVPNGSGNSFNGPNPEQKAEYCFKVDHAGTYRIKGWAYAETGQDNSFFVQVDEAPTEGYWWNFTKNTTYKTDYVSDNNGADPVEVTLSQGEHTVTVFLREDGARLDKLELELVTSDLDPTLE